MAEEIEALRADRKLSTIVFFLDETFEELPYGCMTTVGEAVETLSSIIRLQQFQTFSLFESRKQLLLKSSAAAKEDAAAEESVILQDGTLISDVLQDFRVAKAEKKEAVQMRLVFKKRMFRDTDENITEPMFINLSYSKPSTTTSAGTTRLARRTLCSSQRFRFRLRRVPTLGQGALDALSAAMARFVPRSILQQRPREDWATDTQTRHRALTQHSKEDARMGLLRMIRSLPYGGSIFFPVKRIEDPIGLLPGRIVLGINKRGIHFFRPVPMEYLHSAELRDIMQFGSSAAAVFFKMHVAGVLHIFQFDTKQGEAICIALQTHINDVMMKRYNNPKQKAAAAAAAAAGGDPGGGRGALPPATNTNGSAPASAATQAASDAAFTKQAAAAGGVGGAVTSQMQKGLEDANRKLDEMVRERAELQSQLQAAKEAAEEAADIAAQEKTARVTATASVESLNAELAETKSQLADAEARAANGSAAAAASDAQAKHGAGEGADEGEGG